MIARVADHVGALEELVAREVARRLLGGGTPRQAALAKEQEVDTHGRCGACHRPPNHLLLLDQLQDRAQHDADQGRDRSPVAHEGAPRGRVRRLDAALVADEGALGSVRTEAQVRRDPGQARAREVGEVGGVDPLPPGLAGPEAADDAERYLRWRPPPEADPFPVLRHVDQPKWLAGRRTPAPGFAASGERGSARCRPEARTARPPPGSREAPPPCPPRARSRTARRACQRSPDARRGPRRSPASPRR